jgi:hypothetical protein
MTFAFRSALCALFSLLGLATASADSCVLSGPRYQLEWDAVEWSMNINGGQSCIQGLRFGNVVLEGTKLIAPPEKGQLKLYNRGFLYKTGSDFEGTDSFTIQVSGMINRVQGNSTIHIAVRSPAVSKSSDRPRTQGPSRKNSNVPQNLIVTALAG